jgi:hypothetical protein
MQFSNLAYPALNDYVQCRAGKSLSCREVWNSRKPYPSYDTLRFMKLITAYSQNFVVDTLNHAS